MNDKQKAQAFQKALVSIMSFVVALARAGVVDPLIARHEIGSALTIVCNDAQAAKAAAAKVIKTRMNTH
jgi:hypothetical protein